MICEDCKYSEIGFLGFSKCNHPVVSNDWELRGVIETNGNVCKYFDKDLLWQ